MITVKFSPRSKLSEVEVFELKTYKEFFKWYLKHCNKGAIYSVKDDGYTK